MSAGAKWVVWLVSAAVGSLGCSGGALLPLDPGETMNGPVVVNAGSTHQLLLAPGSGLTPTVERATAVPPTPAPYRFPLRASTDGRYLVDRDGRPWRIQADSAWLMSTNATPEEVETYLRTRKAQGFNAFYLMAMVHPGGYGPAPHAPGNANGDPPFATPGLFTTAGASSASERYWQWIDHIVDRSAAHGLVVMLAYSYLGYEGGPEGWYEVTLRQPSRDACREYGAWIGGRYRDRPNVVWFTLGDYTPPAGSEGEARALAMIEGIRASGAAQLTMAEASGGASVPTLDAPAYAHLLDMNAFYGYGPSGHGECYVEADRASRASPPKPAWVQEGTYENENNTGGFTAGPWETRRTRYWGVLAGGIAGDGFGSRPAWLWQGIPGSLHTPGAQWSTVAFGLFASLPWWDLRPSGTGPGHVGRELVVKGQGAWGYRDRVVSAATSSGSHILAYVPPRPRGGQRFSRQWLQAVTWIRGSGSRTIEVDLTALSGPARAYWFDPTTGEFRAIDGGRVLPASGTRSFTTPRGERADGTDDWLLFLEAEGASPCGSVGPTGVYSAPPAPPQGVTCAVVARRPDGSPAIRIPVEIR